MKYCIKCGQRVEDVDKYEPWTSYKICRHCKLMFEIIHQDRMSGCSVDPVINVHFRFDEEYFQTSNEQERNQDER